MNHEADHVTDQPLLALTASGGHAEDELLKRANASLPSRRSQKTKIRASVRTRTKVEKPRTKVAKSETRAKVAKTRARAKPL